MRRSNKKYTTGASKLMLLIFILAFIWVGLIGFELGMYVASSSRMTQAQRILAFMEALAEKTLISKEAVSKEDFRHLYRLEIALQDPEVDAQWDKIIEASDDETAQRATAELFYLLIQKLRQELK